MRARTRRQRASIALCGAVLLWSACRSQAGSPESPTDEPAARAPASSAALSLPALAGTEWVLRAWDEGEPAPDEPEMTLVYRDGRFAGKSGCNRYTAAATARDAPGGVEVGPIAGTRMACREPHASVEARFLSQLARATKLELVSGRLALSYEKDGGGSGTMLFEARRPAPHLEP